ncbi:radical SAM protein [bacterium]|nr:radical SAM protein [bacterium]
MFSFLDKFFKKDNKNEMPVPDVKEYVSCKSLQGGITFMHRSFRVCCSNKVGVTLVDNYKGEPIDWKKIAETRKKLIEDCKRGILPDNCKGCVDLQKRDWGEHNQIDDIYINHWDHCNCGCVYCVVGNQGIYLETEKKPSRYYEVYKHLKEMYNHNMISPNAHVEIVGGDLTVLDEADNIINLCLDHGVGRMSFHSSCINYSQGIERALKEAPDVDFDFSLDSGERELYKKIKRIDAFDKVVENIRRYMSVSEKSKDALIAKYILVDGLNDSVEAIDKWLNVINDLGIKKAKVDVNFKKFFPEFHHSNPTVPPHYYDIYSHYKKRIEEMGIQDCCWEFTRRVMEEGGIPKSYLS